MLGFVVNARFELGLAGLGIFLLGLTWLFFRARRAIYCSWVVGVAALYVLSVGLLASSQTLFRGLFVVLLGVLFPYVFLRWLLANITCVSTGGPANTDA